MARAGSFPSSTVSLLAIGLSALTACADDPAPLLPDSGPRVGADARPMGPGDTGLRLDSGGPLPDSGVMMTPDSGVPETDSGVPADGSVVNPDGSTPGDDGSTPGDDGSTAGNDGSTAGDDGSAAGDDGSAAGNDGSAAGSDGSAPVDAGPQIADSDNDTISDADEGNGIIDADADGIPDSMDTDSDGDRIPDAVEAGDADLSTPPVDTDGDGVADFRDRDSDGDGVFDLWEGVGDPDLDGVPNYLDDDSDGDGIDDVIEGGSDNDNDGVRNFLDLDSDNDGIGDSDEGVDDLDSDSLPNFIDTDSDGDGIDDSVELMADPDGDNIPAFLDTDSDGDGIDDSIEGQGDPDGDMIGNWLDIDADGDTIADNHEGVDDHDRDGTPNYLDLDSDADGLDDAVEAGRTNVNTPPVDSDFDQQPDFLDVDSDNDHIGDTHEGIVDTDGDLILDRHDIDSDNDSILDDVEGGDTSTVTPPVDTDMDGTPDFQDTDSDDDTILDIVEGTVDTDNDGNRDSLDRDSDGDTWLDAQEAGDPDLATPPVDTDMDNRPDYVDVDSDGDGLADAVEPGCPAGPERLLADSDGDTFVDPAEIAYGSDPCDIASIIDDFYFVLPPGGPGDDDRLIFNNTNIDRADLAINVDNTGSMGGEIANLRTSLSGTIIPGVSQSIPDVAFGVTSFEDYPILPFGNASQGDLPFRLLTRVTTDPTTAQNAVNAMQTRNGEDIPESGVESLYQIATGAGTSWPGGSVPAFNAGVGHVPGVADGTIGGVGFRDGALPIVVHVTDAPSHVQGQYLESNGGIGAHTSAETRNQIDAIGARVVTIANQNITQLQPDPFSPICNKTSARFLGSLDLPTASDTDWFALQGANSGDQVVVETFAWRLASTLDTQIGIYNGFGQIDLNDDFGSGHYDSRLAITLSGPGPYYVAISSWGDPDFNGGGARTSGWWFAEVSVNGQPYSPDPVGCAADHGDGPGTATGLVNWANAQSPPNTATCIADCEQRLDLFPLPYGMSLLTRAVIPTCAWDAFGGGRPAGCGPNECCTGLSGAGVPPVSSSRCPLTFQIDSDGNGIDTTVVSAIEALVNFSPFTITTVVRADPAELASSGLDTSCFIHGVVPQIATPPNNCAPAPTAVDLVPPSPDLDSWENVVPGTVLEFQVNAINLDSNTGTACVASMAAPQLFRAFIDVVADGVTVVDTRDVIIIVPPLPPSGNN